MGGGHARSYPGVPPQNINFLDVHLEGFPNIYKITRCKIPSSRLGAHSPDPDFLSWNFSPSDLRPLRLGKLADLPFFSHLSAQLFAGFPPPIISVGFWLKCEPSVSQRHNINETNGSSLCHAWAATPIPQPRTLVGRSDFRAR